MGTNYYLEVDKCECCQRSEKIHIGKKSYGWVFMFRGYYKYETPLDIHLNSWYEWKKYLLTAAARILNEYDEYVPLDEFIDIVEESKNSVISTIDGILQHRTPKNHYWYCQKNHPEIKDVILDDGYPVTFGEFS